MDITGLVTFLKELRINNEKEWFDLNRKRYLEHRTDFLELVEAVIFLTGAFDEKIRFLQPKNCIFRINRDVRFSKDKSLYKTHLGASFSEEKNGSKAGYYFEINADGDLYIGGGLYMPDAKQLVKIRDSIDTQPEKIKAIIENPVFVKTFGKLDGERLKTAPRGYPKDHVDLDLLQLKSFAVGTRIEVSKVDPNEIHKYIASHFEILNPFVEILRRITG
jgi:uncharacterized protein (TIGR02453 family)